MSQETNVETKKKNRKKKTVRVEKIYYTRPRANNIIHITRVLFTRVHYIRIYTSPCPQSVQNVNFEKQTKLLLLFFDNVKVSN